MGDRMVGLKLRTTLAVISACLLLVACGSLPRGAGLQSEITGGSADAGASADFVIYPVTRAFLSASRAWPSVESTNLRWLGQSHGSAGRQLRAGDTVNVTIWDSSENSLLTSPEQRLITLPNMQLSGSGTVFLPYVGTLKLSGLTPDAARRRVQSALDEIVPQAQVQLSMVEGRQNSVDLISGVSSPGSYPLLDNDYSVLSLIAAGGGANGSLENPQVRLHRGHTIYGISLATLLADPKADTRLRGGDQIFIEEDPRSFLSLGAAGQEARHVFPKDDVTALDAMAIIGGVNDARADPQGVLILREYPSSALTPGRPGPINELVVFTIDLTSAEGLFAARNFEIENGDLVYATESPVTQAQTVFGLIGSVFGLVSSTSSLTN